MNLAGDIYNDRGQHSVSPEGADSLMRKMMSQDDMQRQKVA